MPYSFKTYSRYVTTSTSDRFVESYGWTWQYPQTPKPYGESSVRTWEPFNQFQAYYQLTIPSTPPVYNINYNPLVLTYSKIGKIYFLFQTIIIYEENLIYPKKAINNYQYFNICPDTSPSIDSYATQNPVTRIIMELFKPGITLRVNFRKAFYYENAQATP